MTFQPGFRQPPPGGGGGGGSPTSVTFQASAVVNAETITVPAGVIAGDLIVLHDNAINSGGGSSPSDSVVPDGFTSVVDQGAHPSASVRQIVSYKIADGSEAGTSLTGMVGTFSSGKTLAVFRGNNPISSVNASTPNEQITSGNPTAQSVLASGGTPPLIVFGFYGTEGNISGTTGLMSPTQDGSIISPDNHCRFLWKVYNSSPADVTVDIGDVGNNNSMSSFFLAVS